MDWTAGYASDIEYTAGFYREQGPALLSFVCALNGYEPVPLDRPYACFELGFGRGLTANVLAAANPMGIFYATDFNPAHVASASALAATASLDNLFLLESSFADLAQGRVPNLPQFDFITLHGIYTWVTAENRQHIVDFIGRYLKPGGVVYMSYNAMPGWSAALPLQRLLVEYGDAFPNRSDVQIDGAAKLIERMTAAGAGAFAHGPVLKQRLGTIKTGNRNYLVHEYMHKHWQPLYHADVARQMGEAKLEFVGSAELPFVYRSLYLNPERQSVVAEMPDPAMRETLVDYMLNTAFRKDVFVRGARKMSATRRQAWMAQVGVALLVPRTAVNHTMKLAIGEVNGVPEVFDPICDALAERPHTILELSQLPALAGQNFENIVQTVSLLAASNQLALFEQGDAEHDAAPALRMNLALADLARFDDEYHTLCSPLLGNGISAPYLDRLTYSLVAQLPASVEGYDVRALAQQGWAVMGVHERTLLKDGVKLAGADANIAELEVHIAQILETKLPLWRQLKML